MEILNFKDMSKSALSEYTKKIINVPKELSFTGRNLPGTVNLVCGTSGMGKSWCLMQMSVCLAVNGFSVLYVSLENDIITDMERVCMLKELYNTNDNDPWYYVREPVWEGKAWLESKEIWRDFQFIFIDGLEYAIDLKTDNICEEFKYVTKSIQKKFPNSCLWFSWQLRRDAKGRSKDKKLILEDIAGSYAVARIAYNVLGVSIQNEERIISSLKSRGSVNDAIGKLVWGCRFDGIAKQGLNLGDLLKYAHTDSAIK